MAGRAGRALHWAVEPVCTGAWTFDGRPLWGALADASTVEAFVSTLDGTWRRELPVTDDQGRTRSWIWRSDDGSTVLPFDPDDALLTCRSEAYHRLAGERRAGLRSLARRAYYALRPILPRRLQIGLRRRFARIQARAAFPRWPIETSAHALAEFVLARTVAIADEPLPLLAPWPDGHRWALVLTHDVEQAAGRDAIPLVLGTETARGLRSSWNLVPERYEVPDELVGWLVDQGCEVGVHGLRHDGRDLESLATIGRRLPEIRRWAERWGAVGFRSPATNRHWDWMPLLGFDYDSSYPDSDPYEPMAGGCCWWLPFFNDDLVELPITLPQDHTVFVILQRDERLWREKANTLRDAGGMALLITHPDYLIHDGLLEAYTRFLDSYADDEAVWHALPQEVSSWWRRRRASHLRRDGGTWHVTGPAAGEASLLLASTDPSTVTDRVVLVRQTPTPQGAAVTVEPMATVDAVIVSYNSRGELRGCVQSLLARNTTNVVVVDNASPDRSLDVVADLPVIVCSERTTRDSAQPATTGCGAGPRRSCSSSTPTHGSTPHHWVASWASLRTSRRPRSSARGSPGRTVRSTTRCAASRDCDPRTRARCSSIDSCRVRAGPTS